MAAFLCQLKPQNYTSDARAQPVNIRFDNQAAVLTNSSMAFQFGVTLLTNLSYRIQYSSNLINWANLTNFTATNPPYNFSDSSIVTNQTRFYRVVTP